MPITPASIWNAIAIRCSIGREIALEPVANDLFNPAVVLAEHEVIDAAHDVQVAVITGALEQLHRPVSRNHFVLGAVQ